MRKFLLAACAFALSLGNATATPADDARAGDHRAGR